MAKLTPDATYTANGVKVNVKIIPDSARWTDAAKAKAAGFSAGSKYKACKKLNGNGVPNFVTIHNTGDLKGTDDDAEQYTRATWPNQNMNSSRVHFFVDDLGAWQNLKAGTGAVPQDPAGSAEVGWHAGDGSNTGGGNGSSVSIEIIMGDTSAHDAKAKDNGARLAAWLLDRYGLGIDDLVTHTYWVNRSSGRSYKDRDKQSTSQVAGKKWCPTYILGSVSQARTNWLSFKKLVQGYMQGEAAPGPSVSPSKPASGSQGYDTAKEFNAAYKKTFTVSASAGLHIRRGAGTGKESLGVLSCGTRVKCYGYYNRDSSGQIWLCVVSGGTTGYCSKAYLK